MSFINRLGQALVTAAFNVADKSTEELKAVLFEDGYSSKLSKDDYGAVIRAIDDPEFIKSAYEKIFFNPEAKHTDWRLGMLREASFDYLTGLPSHPDIEFLKLAYTGAYSEGISLPNYDVIIKLPKGEQKKELVEYIATNAKDEDFRKDAMISLASQEKLKELAFHPDLQRERHFTRVVKKLRTDQDFLKQYFDTNAEGDEETPAVGARKTAVLKMIEDPEWFLEKAKAMIAEGILKDSEYRYTNKYRHFRDILPRIKDDEFLDKILTETKLSSIKEAALTGLQSVDKLRKLYEETGEQGKGKKGYENDLWVKFRTVILKRIAVLDPEFIAKIVLKEKKTSLRIAALEMVEDQETLVKFLKMPRLASDVRGAAIAKVIDIEALKDFAMSSYAADKEQSLRAVERVARLKAGEQQFVYEWFAATGDSTYGYRLFVIEYLAKDFEIINKMILDPKVNTALRLIFLNNKAVDSAFLKQLVEVCDETFAHTIALKLDSRNKSKSLTDQDVASAKALAEKFPADSNVVFYILRMEKVLEDTEWVVDFYKSHVLGMDAATKLVFLRTSLPFVLAAKLLEVETDVSIKHSILLATVPGDASDSDIADFIMRTEPVYMGEARDSRTFLVRLINDSEVLKRIVREDKHLSLKLSAYKQLVTMKKRDGDLATYVLEKEDSPDLRKLALTQIEDLDFAVENYPDEIAQIFGSLTTTREFSEFVERLSNDQMLRVALKTASKRQTGVALSNLIYSLSGNSPTDIDLAKKVISLPSMSPKSKRGLLLICKDEGLNSHVLETDNDPTIQLFIIDNMPADKLQPVVDTILADEKKYSESLRAAAVLRLAPEKMTASLLKIFRIGYYTTDEPNRIAHSLIKAVYDLVDPDDVESADFAESLASRLPNMNRRPEHQRARDKAKYLEPVETKNEGAPVKESKVQLYRLMLSLARP